MSTTQIDQSDAHKALVVDDNPLMRMLLSSMLMHRGFSVTEDCCAEGALSRLEESAFDLVALDIMLNKMSGMELCHSIREELGLVELPVLAYTACDDLASVAQMRMAGFNDFLFKPLDGRALDAVFEGLVIRH